MRMICRFDPFQNGATLQNASSVLSKQVVNIFGLDGVPQTRSRFVFGSDLGSLLFLGFARLCALVLALQLLEQKGSSWVIFSSGAGLVSLVTSDVIFEIVAPGRVERFVDFAKSADEWLSCVL